METELAIGEVAERSGLAVSAIRFYEDRGLVVSKRTAGGQRRFRRDVLRRLAFIQAAQRVGLTLDERIALLCALRDQLDHCIGCGCLSLERCRLSNPGDRAARLGSGPRYLLGDQPDDHRAT